MKETRIRFVLLGVGLAAWSVAFSQTAAGPAGHWEGKIQIPEHEIGVTVDLDRSAKGAWIGSISVNGSTSIDVPLSGVAVDGAAVRFSATLPRPASFEGHLSADGTSLSGNASNADGQVPFQLTRTGEAHVKVPASSSPLSKEFEGSWEGAIDSNGIRPPRWPEALARR